MSSFLDRFIGKTQTISKMGPQQMLKGNDQNIIYTNTNKSFDRAVNSHRFNPKHKTKGSEKEEESNEGDVPLHLPHLEQRFMDSQMRKKKVEQEQPHRSRVYLDKETNWIIEQPSQTLKVQQNENRTIASVDTQNEKPLFRDKEEKRMKSQHIKKSMGRLGGLGPNIGGQQWQIKKQKQQKIKKYANDLKKVHRQKLKKQTDENINILMRNGELINY